MRICVVYDCLYPWTVGGGERWYHGLAEAFAADGHDVTYLTRREWPAGEAPGLAGVHVVAVAPGGPLYSASGRRRIGPPLRFGLGVLRHLVRHRRTYDAVHTGAFPFFSLLAARIALARTRTVVAVDWFEVWTLDYWRDYLGAAGGRIGHAVQRACVRATPLAFVFSDIHARRLRGEGLRRPVVKLDGLFPAQAPPRAAHGPARAGRRVRRTADPREARVPHRGRRRGSTAPAAGPARRRHRRRSRARPPARGRRPSRGRRRDRPARVRLGRGGAETLASAGCHLLPSAREGYGLVVIEAAACGTPSVVVDHPDNAAVELVEEGVNGAVAASSDPQAIADAVVRVIEAGAPLRERTAAWFAERAGRLTVSGSMRTILAHYAAARPGG